VLRSFSVHRRRTTYVAYFVVLCAGMLTASICGAQVERIPLPNSSFPISQGVMVGDTLYLSGMLDPELGKGTAADTKTQTVRTLEKIKSALSSRKMGLGDIVMMHVYLAPDPGGSGKMDFAGFMAGYSQYFGTREQPNKPARSAMQVAALAAPGALVEIEVIAVQPK
jgi:enamine deaminase RidA (YjgF/YER057c/UK114 family)